MFSNNKSGLEFYGFGKLEKGFSVHFIVAILSFQHTATA